MANIPGTDASDVIQGTGDIDIITGGLGDDRLHGEGGDDVVSGGFNNDSLQGGLGKDILDGGSGYDGIADIHSGDRCNGGLGADVFAVFRPAGIVDAIIDGGLGRDLLQIDLRSWDRGVEFAVRDPLERVVILGDLKVVNVERFIIDGSDFGDTLIGGHWGDWFFAGDDRIQGGGGGDRLDGGRGEDNLSGGDGWDNIFGGAGNDTANGDAGNDTLEGGDGNDVLSGADGNDVIHGDAGNDDIRGGVGNDDLRGGAGIDTIDAGAGDDVVQLTLHDGADTLGGGDGKDVLQIDYLSGTFDASTGRLADGGTFSGFEAYRLFNWSQTSDDKWTGANGDDHMFSRDGDDTLSGGKGNDKLNAGTGFDIVRGGEGNDEIIVDGGGEDYVSAGTGIDLVAIDRTDVDDDMTFYIASGMGRIDDGTVVLDAEHYVIRSGQGHDRLTAGGALSVAFYGNGGNDQLTGGAGNDRLEGGDGNDTLVGSTGNDTLYGNDGSDTIVGGDGNDTVFDYGVVGNIDAGAGIDNVDIYIASGTALSSIQLGTGNDVVRLNQTNQVSKMAALNGQVAGRFLVDGGAGTDVAIVGRSQATKNLSFVLSANAILTNGDVTLKNIEAVQIWSGSGADSLTGGAYSDLFGGGAGNDTLRGLGGNDILYGGFGADLLEGGDGNDTLQATEGTDADTHVDRLYAGAGDDNLRINQGDVADAGIGIDRIAVDLSNQAAGVTFTFTNGLVRVNATTSFTGAESLGFSGTSGNDTVIAGGLADTLHGHAGNDMLRGGGGNDVLMDGLGSDRLYGDAGDDTLTRTVGAGTDLIDGGAGIDTLKFDGSMSVILDLANNANNGGAAKGLTVTGVEIVHGSWLDDDIRGGGADETLLGGGMDDVLSGGGGDDLLEGGSGGDLLTGGAGSDRFYYGPNIVHDADQITDFTRGEDKLVIDRKAFGLAASEVPGLVLANEPRASGTNAQFLFETDNGWLWFDRDGAGGVHEAELIVTLAGDHGWVPTLASSDFLFV